MKVKTLVSYWHKCFTPDFKSTKLLLDKHHHHKSLILHHPTSPVLHVLEKLRHYWSLQQQNHNVNSARIHLNHLEILRINSIKSMTPDLLVLSRWAICQWEHFVKCQTKSKPSVPYWGGGCRTRQRTATSGRSRFFLNLGVWSECHSDWCLGWKKEFLTAWFKSFRAVLEFSKLIYLQPLPGLAHKPWNLPSLQFLPSVAMPTETCK